MIIKFDNDEGETTIEFVSDDVGQIRAEGVEYDDGHAVTNGDAERVTIRLDFTAIEAIYDHLRTAYADAWDIRSRVKRGQTNPDRITLEDVDAYPYGSAKRISMQRMFEEQS